MSDIKLFKLHPDAMEELPGTSVAVEKSLQTLIERHLESLLGVRFLASEHSTGKTHRGRIDTLGIDENNRPVIIEYKRALNQNVINQGLSYMSWLMDHKAELKLLVLDRLGRDVADAIEWGSPRLLCIAGDFTKFDEQAIEQIPRNIELIRYRRYGDDLLLFELASATVVEPIYDGAENIIGPKPKVVSKTVTEQLAQAPIALQDRYAALDAFLKALGDDVQVNTLKFYLAYKRIKNFACAEVRLNNQRLLVYVKINPESVVLEPGFTRDVRNVGHYGTGDLEISIDSADDFERAKPLLVKSYEAS